MNFAYLEFLVKGLLRNKRYRLRRIFIRIQEHQWTYSQIDVTQKTDKKTSKVYCLFRNNL